MAETQKIQAETYTSSLLRCPTENYKKMIWATWYRKNENFKQQLKRQRPKVQSTCYYHCSMFDFGCYIILQLQNQKGVQNIFQYGPIKVDPKIELLAKQNLNKYQSFSVTLFLGKNKKMPAKLSFIQKQSQKISLVLQVQKQTINLQYQRPSKWSHYESIFNTSLSNPLGLDIQLLQNKVNFKKSLYKLNIYSHHDNYINLTFTSQESLCIYMAKILYFVHIKIQPEPKKHQLTSQQVLNQLNNLFVSTDFMSHPGTPQIAESVLQDFRNCLLTPKADFQHDIRQFAFSNFDRFIKNDNENSHLNKQLHNIGTHETIGQQMESIDESIASKSKNIQSFASHREQKNQSSGTLQNNMSSEHKNIQKIKSHQFLFNKKQESRNQSKTILENMQQKEKDIKQTQKYTYEELLTISKYLQMQNKMLIAENLKLKEKLQQRQSPQKNKGGVYKLPQFMKKKNSRSNPKTKQRKIVAPINISEQRSSGLYSMFRKTFDNPRSRSRQIADRFTTQFSPRHKMIQSCFNGQRKYSKNKNSIQKSSHKFSNIS